MNEKREFYHQHPIVFLLRFIFALFLSSSLIFLIYKFQIFEDKKNLVCYSIVFLCFLYVLKKILDYNHTYLCILDNGFIWKKGWVPSYENMVFCVNIKDIDVFRNIFDVFLGTYGIKIKIMIRQELEVISIPCIVKGYEAAERLRQQTQILNKESVIFSST